MDNLVAAAHEPPTVAVSLTHLAVVTTLRTIPTMRAALVVEDDVIVRPDALELQLLKVRKALKQLPGWQFVALGCSEYGAGGDSVLRSGMQPCARMYLVSREGMGQMATRGLPLAHPIDNAMPGIFGESNRQLYHATRWPMRHGSHMYRLRRGADF